MDTSGLKKFAQEARRSLRELVSAKLDLALSADSGARREAPNAVKQLESEIANSSREQVIEKVAYTWFNRFSALRFMDANGYTGTRVLSPADGQTRPEILSEAMAGVIGEEVPEATALRVRKLLDGDAPSRDPQGEAYRVLVVALCNHWHGSMPFMFEKIADYTELLMPDDLLSASSVVSKMRDVMTEDACQDVEIIGWLYQFYISEKKDQVFAALKKNVKITAENIPAATQLFTPDWIVRYLVENSLGRLWLLNRPQSKLAAQMDYYVAPEEPETDFLRINSPEEIRICDPACGSGHMLTYAFDLLHAIYEEEGYDAAQIPALILTHNLHGVEIDDRAGALAAFALVMKVAAKLGRRRFLRLGVQPNICVLQDVNFTAAEMQDVAAVVGRDLFTGELRETLAQFEQAKNFGSLIVPKLRDPAEVGRVVRLKDFGGDLLLRDVRERVLTVLHMAEALSAKYHVVAANPPYMGNKGMNNRLGVFAKEEFPDAKSDLFAMFIERGFDLLIKFGYNSMVTMHSWMFLSSYEKLRLKIEETASIKALMHMGNMVMGIAFGTAATVWKKNGSQDEIGKYCFVSSNDLGEDGPPTRFPPKNSRNTGENGQASFFKVSSRDFMKLPGSPIAYWISRRVRETFSENQKFGEFATPAVGQNTGDNERFLREWSEVSINKIGFGINDLAEVASSGLKWFPYNKGGPFRKWYGNAFLVINWEHDGKEVKDYAVERNNGKHWSRYIQNLDKMLKSGVSWSATSSSYFGIRFVDNGFFFDVKGTSAVSDQIRPEIMAAFLSTKMVSQFLDFLNPTIEFQTRDIRNLPFKPELNQNASLIKGANALIGICRYDWDAYETSWNFKALPLVSAIDRTETLQGSYTRLRAGWREMTEKTQLLEEENNRIFIDAYGLQDELTPEVPLEEITLTCNPAYRFGGKATEAELEVRLRADTMAEFLHYAVGCMFGRYSLDAPGLILANQGEGLADYLARVPEPSFMPDEDNVIPMLDGDWFADDISEHFRQFLRVTFGEAHFQENLAFIEEALGKDIRKYFTRDFFNDHVKRYKKRPIYWMFSSPKGSFNALIYMHRYRPDTVSVVLDYLRTFRSKLEAHKVAQERMSINASATAAQRTAALKSIQTIAQQIIELDDWERDVVYPMATRRIEIDLDDGVKANYPKFAGALKPIKGLEEADD